MLLILLLLGSFGAEASSSVIRTDPKEDYVILNEVKIEGNLKTNSRIILRELALHPGDTIYADEAEASLLKDRNKINNTNLFITVEVVLQRLPGQQADLLIRVTERWYLFPMPIFELADRNFNEWWYERGRDLRRTHYGVRVSHKNFRGRNEQFDALVQFGFTRKFELSYNIPYLDKVQKMGLSMDVSFSENKSAAYQTAEHKLIYLKSEDILRKRFKAGIGISRRNRFYMIHKLDFQYNYNQVQDTILLLNPNYYLNGSSRQRFFQLRYSLVRDLRDAVAYPLSGSRLSFDINKLGLLPSDDINQVDITASYAKYTPLGKRFYFNNRFQGKISFPQNQPYANIRGLGFGQDFVRGYELYVIDGQSHLVSKSTLKKGLFNTQANLKKFLPFKQFQTMPIALYINLYFDMGYVNNHTYNPENNFLSNKLLYGSGMGLDLVTFYNTIFRVDFSINKSLQKNIFLHFVRDI